MRTALKLLILVGLLHVAALAVTPHIANRLLRMKVSEIVRESRRNSDQYVEERILEYAAERKIPVTRRNLHVWQQGKQRKVVVCYDRVVAIPFRPYVLDLQVAVPADAVPPGYGSRRR